MGETDINGTAGGLNIFGCGQGCLKCDSSRSGTAFEYTTFIVGNTPKRQCLACDWKKGWAMVGGRCIKTTVEKCF